MSACCELCIPDVIPRDARTQCSHGRIPHVTGHMSENPVRRPVLKRDALLTYRSPRFPARRPAIHPEHFAVILVQSRPLYMWVIHKGKKREKGGGNVQKARMPVCRLCTGPLTTRLPASPVAAAVISQPPPPTEDTGCPGGVFCYLFVAPGPRQGVCIISELYLPRSAGVRGRDDGADPTPMSNPFAASVADKSAASVVCSVRSTGGSSW